MKKIALIDNFNHIDLFRKSLYEDASVEDILSATGGNTGNVAFVYAIEKLILGNVTRINWGWRSDVVNSRFDHIVICAANQVGAHVDLGSWADKVKSFDLPVTVIGLGAQSDAIGQYPEVPNGTVRFLKELENHRADKVNILVRGGFTKEVLERVGVESIVGGCPSLFISKDKCLGNTAYKNQENGIKKVAVAAGNVWHSGSSAIEKMLTDLVDVYSGAYILQHPLSMMKILSNELDGIEEGLVEKLLDKYQGKFDQEMIFQWMRRYSYTFVDVPNWMRFLSHFDLTLGPRYHGVALSIQAGIPGTVITIDSRTEELSKQTGIKSIGIDVVKSRSPEEVVDMCKWSEEDAIVFDENREVKIHVMQDFLYKNKIEPSEHFVKLVN